MLVTSRLGTGKRLTFFLQCMISSAFWSLSDLRPPSLQSTVTAIPFRYFCFSFTSFPPVPFMSRITLSLLPVRSFHILSPSFAVCAIIHIFPVVLFLFIYFHPPIPLPVLSLLILHQSFLPISFSSSLLSDPSCPFSIMSFPNLSLFCCFPLS